MFYFCFLKRCDVHLVTFIFSGVAQLHHGASTECMGCNKPIRSGSIAIHSPRLGEEVRRSHV